MSQESESENESESKMTDRESENEDESRSKSKMVEAFAGQRSCIAPYGYSCGSCGYCKDKETSTSYYASASTLTVGDYQILVDRGWRRSGTLLYLPDGKRACCPHYTIRLPVAEFKAARDQRQALHRWNRFVLGEEYLQRRKLQGVSKERKSKQRNEFDLVASVHESEASVVAAAAAAAASKAPNGEQSIQPEHDFQVTLEESSFTEEKYKLFENYQMSVHKEPASAVSRRGFRRFLCQSPLLDPSHADRHEDRDAEQKGNGEERPEAEPAQSGQQQQQRRQLGSFHQCYRLDGRLIALGVLDLLPHAVSAVYFIYHQDVEQWSFGKLSALREAALALEGGYGYYYMGYYIHSCAKMRYKCDYKPQYMLDPESHEWSVFDDALRARLDRQNYLSVSAERARGAAAGKNAADEPDEPDRPDGDWDGKAGEQIMTAKAAEAAVAQGMSLFDLRLPGMMTLAQLEAKTGSESGPGLDLDKMLVLLQRQGMLVQCDQFVAWPQGSASDPSSIKGVVAQLVACVGPDVARNMVVDFN